MFIKKGVQKAPALQITDLLEISQHEHELKMLCRRYLRETRRHHELVSYAIYKRPCVGLKMKSMSGRRHLRDVLRLYRKARAQRMFLFENYIRSLTENGEAFNKRA